MSRRKKTRRMFSGELDPAPAFCLAFHDEQGRPSGGAVDGAGPDLCGPVGGRILHIVRIPTGQHGDGLRCQCGVFVRRVLPECPTCHRADYCMAERVPGAGVVMTHLAEQIDRVLREQADKELVIETLWQLFAGAVKIPTGGTQWIESRRCFFAGARTLFECILRILEPGEDATEKDLAVMESISNELRRYLDDLAEGTG